MAEHRITQIKPMRLDISFDGPAIEVVAGRGEAQQGAARRIADALSGKCGQKVEVVDGAGYAGWDIRPENQAILVGSLGDNPAIEYLYYRWLTFVDNSYPGTGGHVLTTVRDPWATGANALVVGASDPAGLEAAADRLEQVIGDATSGVPGLYEVAYGSSRPGEVEDVERWATVGPTPDGWVYDFTGYGGLSHVPQAAWAYLRSGDVRIAEGLKQGLMELMETPVLHTAESQLHLGFWPVMMMWPIVETSPAFSEADRLKIVRFLYDVLESPEGSKNHGLIHSAESELPRQNHQTLCALGVLFGSLYFDRHYGLAEAQKWRAVVDSLFRIGEYCSKQICDNNAHGWNQSIGDFATYALLTGNTAFFDNGMARLATDRAVANCTSNGFAATIGDGGVENYPNWFLAQVSYYLRDSGLRFVLENVAPEIARSGRLLPWRQPYDAGLAVEPPADHVGTRVFPLDRLYYDIPKNAPGAVALRAPNVPHGQTFDILTMRSGWGPADQYLILDGTGGGSHSYEDANAILTLAQDDRFLLLSADQLYYTAPKYHNMVTVTRNGLGDELPSYSRLDGKADLPTFGFSETTLVDYVGTDWTRTILWRKGDFYLVLDRLAARERATYGAVCRWFSLGKPEIDGGRCTFHQSEWKGSRTDFVIENLSDQAPRVQEVYYGPTVSWKLGFDPALGEKLRTDRTLLKELDQSQSATLEAGEQVQFVNLLYARSGGRVTERMETQVGDSGWMRIETADGPVAIALAGDEPVNASGLRANCSLLAVWRDGIFAAGCTALSIGDASVQFSRPCCVEVADSGRVTVDATESLTILWRAGNGDSGECETNEDGVCELEIGAVRIPDPGSLLDGSRKTGVQAARLDGEPSGRGTGWNAECSGRINALHVASLEGGGRVLAACEGGALAAYELDGTPDWTYETGSPVNTVHSGVLRAGEPARIVLGCQDEFVRALDSSTREEVWRYRPEYGNQYWAYWSWYDSSIKRVWVEDLDGDGNGEVIVTPGNMRLHLVDAEGRELWEYRTDHGTFLTYETCDLDGDGTVEIVGGNDILSSGSTCRVIGVDGQQKHAFANAGWTSQVKDVLIADLDGDGKLEVACAVSRQENLRVHSFEEKARRWGHCLGEVPAGLALLRGPDGPVLFAATEGATAIGFGATGDPLWRADVSPGASWVVRMDGSAAVVCSDGRVLRVTGDGATSEMGCVPVDVTASAYTEGWLLLGGEDGSIAAFEV